MDCAELKAQWSTVTRITSFVCRKHRLREPDAEDFHQFVAVRLLDKDCAIVRQFRGESKLSTYLSIVIERLYLDHLTHERGKWHASAEATRLGEAAMELERCLYRDSLPFDEAKAKVRRTHPEVDDAAFDTMLERMPRRIRRRPHSPIDEVIEQTVAAREEADMLVIYHEREQVSEHAAAVVRRVLGGLREDDRLLLQMNFESEMQISQIARTLGMDQKFLYRRREKLLRDLRSALEAEGIGADDARDLIGNLADGPDFGLRNGPFRPSRSEEETVAGHEVRR